MWLLWPSLLLAALLSCAAEAPFTQHCDPSTDGTIYGYQATTLNGSRNMSFSDFTELNALQEEMKPAGLRIVGFPCNQFGKQEPGTNQEILPGLKHVRPGNGFVPNFPLFEKGDVNGENEQEIFTFLKNSCPPVGEVFGTVPNRLFWEPLKLNDIKWNFEKFLVGTTGKPVMRWHPSVRVSEVRADIHKYLRQFYTQQIFN